jgi:hypothetical protein
MLSCPYLPEPPSLLDASALSYHGKERGTAFYFTALTYAHYLWQKGLPSRSILILDRALGADVPAESPVLVQWPLPYSAMAWVLRNTPPERFAGNPRVHFQHLADRMNEPRREQRRWRIWACWYLCRLERPDLHGDVSHFVEEPSLQRIEQKLLQHGVAGELEVWRRALELSTSAQALVEAIA